MYKAFRKSLSAQENSDEILNLDLWRKIIKKENNKYLHPDEQDFLIGFINRIFERLYKSASVIFDSLEGRYFQSYKARVRNVIGIDEATDYSLMDYYFMTSFRDYEFSSITLCGDIMQGLNHNGIQDWEELKKDILPELDKVELLVSYRQSPTLLELAREMYKDDQGQYPPYSSDNEKSEHEALPLVMVSDDEDAKANWIADRILDIYESYGNDLPSIAIFVGDDYDIDDLVERINDLNRLNPIIVKNCSNGNSLDSKDVVRVFKLSEVKGMEFEAAFFYDIDEAVSKDAILARRYLYVGLSRAASHLAVLMNNSNGLSSLMEYFSNDDNAWLR